MTGGGNHTYLIAGTDGSAVLVDAGVGHPDHVQAVAAALTDRRATLTTVAVTHGHADHASGAPALAARHPAAVFAKCPGPEDVAAGVRWTQVDEGDRVCIGDDDLVVLRTPGHAPDHIALWHEPTRSLFTGDLVVQGGSVMIAASRGGNLIAYLASLERLIALEPRVLFPAHGPRIDDPAAILTAYLAHRREREQQVIAALEAGRSTVQDIAESIYDELGPELMAAARATVGAHLEKLKAEGRLKP
jgi:glyoxylase-like metal-dependent hydrolase (beta-lactamase superfamily II)